MRKRIDCGFELSTHVATTTVMSERVRRSSRLQDKRTKLIAKVRKKSCRIADDDSSSSDSLDPADGANDSVLTSSNTSFTRRKNQIGSRGGNFTRV